MTSHLREVTFRDELLADRSVCRRYSDGRVEWRTQISPATVEWRDNRNRTGVDELLGDGVIKRTSGSAFPVYGKEQGYGRTAWSNLVMTVNHTSLQGRSGRVLGALAGGALLGALVMPPTVLSAADEEALRARERAAQSSSGDGGGSGGSSGSAGGDSGSSSEAPPRGDAEPESHWNEGDAGDFAGDDDFG